MLTRQNVSQDIGKLIWPVIIPFKISVYVLKGNKSTACLSSVRALMCAWVNGIWRRCLHSPGHTNPAGLVSGHARLSHVSRSLALSMLGFSCLAHSCWQRCHKTRLREPISGEEEVVERLTRRGPYALPVVGSLPQAVFLSPVHIALLHCLMAHWGSKSARTSGLLKLSALI